MRKTLLTLAATATLLGGCATHESSYCGDGQPGSYQDTQTTSTVILRPSPLSGQGAQPAAGTHTTQYIFIQGRDCERAPHCTPSRQQIIIMQEPTYCPPVRRRRVDGGC